MRRMGVALKQRISANLIQTYVIPLVLAIAVLALSQLLNLVKVTDLLLASGLCAVIIVGLFIGQYAAFSTLRIQERDALFAILSTISFSGAQSVSTSGILTQSEVLGLESVAREVWIYAYDLKYEQFDRRRSPFTSAVSANLVRGVSYRYLLPNSDKLKIRAERMYEYLQQFAKSVDSLEFRITSGPPLFNQFAVTLYNPDRAVAELAMDSVSGTVAIFFPHADDFNETEGVHAPFIAVRDRQALVLQEKFEQMWRDSGSLAASQTQPRLRPPEVVDPLGL